MNAYDQKLLTMLVEKFRKSKKDDGSNVINRLTRISPSQLYKKYDQNDGDPDEIDAVNECIYKNAEKGFVTFDEVYLSNEIPNVFLVDEKVEEIEAYLEQQYGYQSKASKKRSVQKIIDTYIGASPTADRLCQRLQKTLVQNRIPKDYQFTEAVLKAVALIENNQEELFLREASMVIYGSSKVLEEPRLLTAVCRELRKTWDCSCGEDELLDEVLLRFKIHREKQKICIKGNVRMILENGVLDLSSLENGIQCFYEDLKDVREIEVLDERLMTIENYTSWMRMKKRHTTIFYLGGYATRDQREFLKRLYADHPTINYLHFGDIDAGGFYIYEHLCRVTGIPFKRYLMDIDVLKDSRYQSCLQPLTDQDLLRLSALQKEKAYEAVTTYMLTHHVKLEQEIVSLNETEQVKKHSTVY